METEHASGAESLNPHLDPMKSWNWITLTGCLGKDADLRYTKSAKAVTALSMAQSDKDRTGKVLGTHWYEVTCWAEVGERAGKFKKGQWITVRGTLKTKQWTTKAGQVIKSTYILAREVHPVKFQNEKPRPSTDTFEQGQTKSHFGPDDNPYSDSFPHWTPPAQDDQNTDPIPF